MYTYYYQTGFGYRMTLGVKNLIIINSIIYVLQLFFLNQLINLFGLIPSSVYHNFMFWQLISYMFLHGDIFHILFNMLSLWMFGSPIEARWGTNKFVKYYFLCGIGGGIVTCLISPTSTIPSIGASAAIFGILLAYGMIFPKSIVLLFGLFPMKAKHFVILFGAIELLACLRYTPDGIGHFAHLGGLLAGYLYMKNILAVNRMKKPVANLKEKEEKEDREKKKVELSLVKRRVDELLDKISSQGLDSLSQEEKDFLKKAGSFLQEHHL